MSLQDVINLIQTWIVENGNEEITADVLRPILEAMVNQPNDLIGDLDDLDTTDRTNLVAAINEVKTIAENNIGLVIHYGDTTPLVTPPASFGLGDFFAQVISPSTAIVSFWQYNGAEWVKIEPNKIKTVFRFVSLVGITTTGKTPLQWAKEAINAAIAENGNFTCNQGELMTFYFNLVVQSTPTDTSTQTIDRRYFRLCSGETVCSGISNAFQELMPDGGDIINIDPSFLIDLGDIGSDDVEDAFNSDPNQPFAMTDEKFVQATQNGTLKLWQWRGGTGTFGSSATLATADDFLDLTAQPSVPSEVNKLFYEDIPAMLANQEEQGLQHTLCVADASADTNITFPAGETRRQAYYRYLGTATGTMADYELIGAPWAIRPPQQKIQPGNFTLAPEDNDNTISMDGGICTINPNTQTYQDAYIVAMKNITDSTDGSIVCTAAMGWTYKVNDNTTVASGTFTFPAGATCTIIKFEETQIIYIDGGVE